MVLPIRFIRCGATVKRNLLRGNPHLFLGFAMTTAQEVMREAYFDIQAHGAGQDIPPDFYNTAVVRLNALITSEPVIPNFTVITSSSDEMTSPDYCNRWIIKALALELSPQYGTLESYTVLEDQKKDAFSVILRSNSRIGPPTLSANIPYGSGNRRPGSRYSGHYYPEEDNGILTETNEEIIVEDDT